MPVKIRLARHGSKKYAFYHIVVADSRAPRDGKYIERIGSYNPNTHPATVVLDFDKALNWVQKGALPTDTCRVLLSEKGVLYKKHLLGGVKKGAFSEEEVVKIYGEIRGGYRTVECDCLACNPEKRESLTLDLDVGDKIGVLKPSK